MCAGLLAHLPDEPQEPKEPKPAVSLDQEFSINATIYSARAWLSNDDTFAQDIWKATQFASASHAGKSIFPVGSVKIINFSDDTITITASPESDHALKIVVPPHSEAALTSGPFHIYKLVHQEDPVKSHFSFTSFSQGILVQINKHKKVQLRTVPFSRVLFSLFNEFHIIRFNSR